MLSPTLIDASDLEVWAARRDAQERLPQLVRRLILATAERVKHIRFAAGEGVQLGGWDGVVSVVAGNTWVPDGLSVWEMGTTDKVRQKAESDYKKRSTNPRGVEQRQAVFVFVTPRRWDGKDAWVEEKIGDGLWRSVRALDADDLHTWLEVAPSVHYWITSVIGKPLAGAEDLETHWHNWQHETMPPVPGPLVLSGRDEAADRVKAWLAGPASSLALRADSQAEALAFLAAVIDDLQADERDATYARAIVVSDDVAWRAATLHRTPLLLVPTKAELSTGLALAAGHHVFVPLDRSAPDVDGLKELPRLRRAGAVRALVAVGVPEERARTLATLARRGLLSFRRRIAGDPARRRPAWAQAQEAPALLPTLLAGLWDEGCEGDREALATIACQPYEQLARAATRWANEADPPLRRIGSLWLLVSREDAWDLLGRFLTPDDLRRLHETTIAVLGAIDPALELPVRDRWMAGALGRPRPHSGHLRQGLAEVLAVMAARASETPLAGVRRDRSTQIASCAPCWIERTRTVQENSGSLWPT